MRKLLLLVGTLLLLTSFLFVGCGVADEQYDAVISDLEKVQQEILAVKIELQTLQDMVSELVSGLEQGQTDLEIVQTELSGLTSSLQETQMSLETTQTQLEIIQKERLSNLQEMLSISDVVAAVKPSVVAIDTEITFRYLRRPFTQQGAGSGWIISEDGYVVTNNHVVAGASSIRVTLDDSRSFEVDPNTIAADPLNDLAVLKINARNLPAVAAGDSTELRVGDYVVAIGNSLGMGISAKEGIVSRLNVFLITDGTTLDNLIETSAAINPGNSGGPLLNMKGQVIGITSAKIASVGVEGLGYAISIDEAIPIIEELIKRLMAHP